MFLKGCAVLSTHKTSFLDHIAPLASLLEIPLLVNDEKNRERLQRYYPEVQVRYLADLEFHLREIAEEFDVLFNCDYWSVAQRCAFQLYTQKRIQLVFCPHGQSDKGYKSPFLTPYGWQETILLYGSLMQEMLQSLQLWEQIPKKVIVGNYRHVYYERYKDRMRRQVEEEVFSRFEKKQKTLLYAPTWNDLEGSGTFFEWGERLLQELPADWNLVLKVHPEISEKEPALYYQLSLLEEKRPNFLLVEDFPLVYPLLEKIDVYLGDYSSIGYDCLVFQKPLYFFQKPHLTDALLHSCGSILDPKKPLFLQIEKGIKEQALFQERKEALLKRAFDPQANLLQALETLFVEEMR